MLRRSGCAGHLKARRVRHSRTPKLRRSRGVGFATEPDAPLRRPSGSAEPLPDSPNAGVVAPDGATDGSQGWSEARRAQPLVDPAPNLVALEGRRTLLPFQGYIVCGAGVPGVPC